MLRSAIPHCELPLAELLYVRCVRRGLTAAPPYDLNNWSVVWLLATCS